MKKNITLRFSMMLVAFLGGVTVSAGNDFIDAATKIEVLNSRVTTEVKTTDDGAGKKKFSFMPIAAGEFQMMFTLPNYKINNRKAFTVVELTGNLNTSGNRKTRKMTIDGVTYENPNNTNWLNFTLSNGNRLAIMSPLSNSEDWYKKYLNSTEDMAVTFANVILATSATDEITINRVGQYSLGEILELYPELKTYNFQMSDKIMLCNDAAVVNASKTNNGTDNGEIGTRNNKESVLASVAACKLFMRVLDPSKLPDNYVNFWFRYFNPADATTEDIFAEMKDNQILMPNFVSTNYLSNTPTMHKKVIDFDRNMTCTVFVDGISPEQANKVNFISDKTANWATYSRYLKAGYNSCMMPMKYLKSVPEGIKMYGVSSVDANGTVRFEEKTPTVSNVFVGTPVIIYAEKEGYYTFVGRDALGTYNDYTEKTVGGSNGNMLFVGSFINEIVADNATYSSYDCYGITSDGKSFAKMGAGIKTTYYRAFLVDKTNKALYSKVFVPDFSGNNPTGITQITTDKADGAVYDLHGMRHDEASLKPGMYIKNGKKFIVR